MNNQLQNRVSRKQLRNFVNSRKEERDAIAEIEALKKIETDAKIQSKYNDDLEPILKEMPNVGYLRQIIDEGDVSNIYKKYTSSNTDQQKKDIAEEVLSRRASVSNTESEDDIRRHLNMVRMQKLGEHLGTVSINNNLLTNNPKIAKSKKQYDSEESGSKNSNLRIAADVLALQRAKTLRTEENKEFQTERTNGYLNMGYMLKNIPALFPDDPEKTTMHKNARIAYCKLNNESSIKTRMLEKHNKPLTEDCSNIDNNITNFPNVTEHTNLQYYNFFEPISISIQQWLLNSTAKHVSNKKYNFNKLITQIQNSLRNLYANTNNIDPNYFFMQLVDNPFISYDSTIEIQDQDESTKLEKITTLYYMVRQLLERATFLYTQKTNVPNQKLRNETLDKILPFKRILEQTLPNIERLAREMLDTPEIRNAQVSAWLGIAAPLYDNVLQSDGTFIDLTEDLTEDYPILANSVVQWTADAGTTNGYTLLNMSGEKRCIFKKVVINNTEYENIRDFYIIYHQGQVEIGFTTDTSGNVIQNTDTESTFNTQKDTKQNELKLKRKNEVKDNFTTSLSGGAVTTLSVNILNDTLPHTIIGFTRDTYGYIHLWKNDVEFQLPASFQTTDVNLRPYIKLTGLAKVEFRIGIPLKSIVIIDQARTFQTTAESVGSMFRSFGGYLTGAASSVFGSGGPTNMTI